jgi:derlin-1
MSASNDLGQWYKSIPKITRVWFTSSIVVSVAARLGLVRPQHLVLFVTQIIKHFQVCFIFSYLFILLIK